MVLFNAPRRQKTESVDEHSRIHSMAGPRLEVPAPGSICKRDARPKHPSVEHVLVGPDDDTELQAVHRWLVARDVTEQLSTAVDSAVRYVLDGARTWRFDLRDPRVDSDERSSVGTKLQYHVIEQLGLEKLPPLDTVIDSIPVDIKGTVNAKGQWMIPREAQCEIMLLMKIDTEKHRFAAWLFRAHRAWLTGGSGNQDKKRNTRQAAIESFGLPVVPWTDLPKEPLRDLDPDQLRRIFGATGLRDRARELFTALPGVVIPRSSLTTVGAGRSDPMRRFREAKPELLRNAGLVVLVGTWERDRKLADELGYDLRHEAWVAVPASRIPEGVDLAALGRK